MPLLTHILWLSELLLESSGAYLSLRNLRYWPLTLLLTFRAIADLICLTASLLGGKALYFYAFWVQRHGQYLLYILLCIWLAGELVGEKNRYKVRLDAALGVCVVLVGLCFLYREPLITARLMDAEIAVSMGMTLLLLVAQAMKAKAIRYPQIVYGLAVLLFSYAGLAFYRTHFNWWNHWAIAQKACMAGEITALGIWARLGWRAGKGIRLLEYRPNVRRKFDCTSVYVPQQSRRVM